MLPIVGKWEIIKCWIKTAFKRLACFRADMPELAVSAMIPNDSALWWTAFGAVAQAVGSVATFAAVAVSLWVVLSERTMKASGSANIKLLFAGDGSPEQRLVGIEVLNTGVRPFHVSSVGWRTGWLPFGPKALRYRVAMMNAAFTLNQTQGPNIIEPGRSEDFYTPMADIAQSASRANCSNGNYRSLAKRQFGP